MGIGLWIVLVIILVLVIVFALYFVLIYNRFQTLKNAAEATLRQIEVALKKRLDMIEQLLEATRGYLGYERDVLMKVTELRSKSYTTVADLNKGLRESQNILGRLLGVFEAYPDLKGNIVVQQLMKSIQDVENEIARQRYTYNNIVQEFNTKLDTFPSNIIGRLMGYQKMEYLEFEENIHQRPTINIYP